MTSTTSRDRVLIVEDDPTTRLGLTELVRTWGFTAEAAADGAEALQRITAFRPSVVISDLVMPRMGGLELLRAIKEEGGDLTVVILTAQGTVETAVEAIKEGAYDYLTKPIEPQRLKILLDKIAERQDTLREVKVLRRQLRDHGKFGSMIGSSAQVRKVYQVVEKASPTSASVLIWGESGTGKELVAQTIHQLSPRAQMPFVPINCAAIPETLLESEIFGHEKGAFTGASDRREGCFELADRGTLFLDEIAEMTPATQVKLLRVLQEQAFERLGGVRTIKVDVRVVAATHRDLEAMVKDGQFRDDLYYRLDVVSVTIPPLRDRKEDIPLLVDQFLRSLAGEGKGKQVSREAMDLLRKHDYPGNVRELENLIHRAVVLARGSVIGTGDLPLHLGPLASEEADESAAFTEKVGAFERGLIRDALAQAGGVQTRAARALGMSERHLRYKLQKYGL